MPNTVILLVGGNPLPNYVAALTLRAELGITKVHLIYTDEVKEVKDNLLRCLITEKFTSAGETYIVDAGNADDIFDTYNAAHDRCPDIQASTHLHYTGGTNAMAVHVHRAWSAKGGELGQASYLFGREARLMTDDGKSIAIPGSISLDLGTLANLHGLKRKPKASKAHGTDPKPADAATITKRVLADPELADRLYKVIPRVPSKLRAKSFDPTTECLTLSQGPIPGDTGWTNDHIKSWWKFLRGEWLEVWVHQQIDAIRRCQPSVVDHLDVDFKGEIKKREFQLDVVAVQGHHLYVVSCTTSHEPYICKSKLFEVSMRARQLGGDLARSALVCLAESHDCRGT